MEKSRPIAKLKKIFSDQRGMAAVFAILVLLIISLWGAATLTLSTNEYHISNSSKKAVQAYYLAEAGIEEAIANLNIGDSSFDGETINLETGSYTVSITSGSIPENGTETIELESLGMIDSTQRTLTLEVELTSSAGGPPTYDNSLPDFRSWGSLSIFQDYTINGNTYAGGSLSVHNNNTFNGDIYVGGAASFHNHTTINGNIFVEGALDFHQHTIINGNIYVKGSFDSGDHFTLNGNIYYDWDSTSGSGGYSLQINELF